MTANLTTNSGPAIRAIEYIEAQLFSSPDLQEVAAAAGYSKYHLHRIFSEETGMTPHQYIRRRKLTEAARLLVFSENPIMDIALVAGYESRQAFTAVFKELYKKTPGQYRKDGFFYPLQLRYSLKNFSAKASELSGNPDLEPAVRRKAASGKAGALILQGASETAKDKKQSRNIRAAAYRDIPKWMELVDLVIDGYPCLEEESYRETLRQSIRQEQALILEEGDEAIGIMAFDEKRGSIDFLGIHPCCRKAGLERVFLQKAFDRLAAGNALTITTFREGDKADTGHRRLLKKLGFTEAELLVEFGYPTQKMLLSRQDFKERSRREADCEG